MEKEELKEVPTEERSSIGPPQISLLTFVMKILAGVGGGIIGTVILIVIFLLSQSVLTPLMEAQTEMKINAIVIFVLMIMVFISSTVGNILSAFFLALTESKKYRRKASAIYQIFIMSVIVFLLMVPVYFITSSVNISIIAYAIALHIIITAQVSALILEIVSNYRHALVGVYSVTFSILISAGILFGLSAIIDSPALLLFAALPVVWGSIGFMHSLVTMIYGWIARIYDKDFLSTQTLYGMDYGKQPEEKEEVEEVEYGGGDKAGADFLRKR